MDTLRLRTMARRSIFEGGNCEYLSVQQVLDLKRQTYLAFQYYNRSKISFTLDVLEELGIIGKLTIVKPGKDTKVFNEWKKWFYGNMDDMERIKRYSMRWKNRKDTLKNHEHHTKLSKSKLKSNQRPKNQSHTGKLK